MDTEVIVHVDLDGQSIIVGRLRARLRRDRESASFQYDEDWLRQPKRFSLQPALQLDPGPFHTTAHEKIFGAMGDSAPDRWGRLLMRRAESRRARNANETPRTLREIDYLLSVNDETRMGALRFSFEPGGPFLASEEISIPPLLELPRLLTAVENILDDSDSEEDLRLLLAPGSSLGGARPKASVKDKGGSLSIAKFPHKDDEFDTVRWEAVALSLAEKSRLEVPQWRLEYVANKSVLFLKRFDRLDGSRVPFLSAMSMLQAQDNETRSYLEFVDALRHYGAEPSRDMQMLWRRIVYNILISNTDDHLRNHGFLHSGPSGWRLAPAYDLNPVPVEVKPRILSTNIDLDDGTASLDRALEVADYFELSPKKAGQIAKEVGRAVSNWRDEAQRLGIAAGQIERMQSAFDHADLQVALSF